MRRIQQSHLLHSRRAKIGLSWSKHWVPPAQSKVPHHLIHRDRPCEAHYLECSKKYHRNRLISFHPSITVSSFSPQHITPFLSKKHWMAAYYVLSTLWGALKEFNRSTIPRKNIAGGWLSLLALAAQPQSVSVTVYLEEGCEICECAKIHVTQNSPFKPF